MKIYLDNEFTIIHGTDLLFEIKLNIIDMVAINRQSLEDKLY